MTDAAPAPDPSEPTPAEGRSERVRVADHPVPARAAVAPVVYAAGAVVLAVALFFLWRYPAGSRRAEADSNRLTALQTEVASLSDRLKALESRTGPDLAPLDSRVARLEGRQVPDIAPLDARVARLEARSAPDLAPLETRVGRLEARPLPPPPTDISGLTARVDTLARDEAAALAKRDADLATLRGRLDTAAGELNTRIAAVDAHVGQVERADKEATGVAARAERTARVQAATALLNAGRPLGTLPDAPPPLTRFATQAPPTDASLRLAFPAAADAARRAAQPAVDGGQGVLNRAWSIAQDAVTVRQGDRVMLGNPVAGILDHAQELLGAGDLSGCLHTLAQLGEAPRGAMSGWINQAQSLLDARTALAGMATAG